jgi:feruloyl esterase
VGGLCVLAAWGVGGAQVADPSVACNALAGVEISSDHIGLPTKGAKVVSAALEAASGTGPSAKPEHCRVLATVAPVDPNGQPITMQVNLPTTWNHKAVQMGGGGLDGFLVTADGSGPGASAQPAPLMRGYATFGSDGGHSVPTPFAVDAHTAAFQNDEVLENYAGAALKKARDVAQFLIERRYGEAPQRLYFVGASGGGREALVVAQRWGADYDGAIAFYPAAGAVPLVAGLGRLSRALAAPGAYPNPAKQALLTRAVIADCDALDGVADGVISHPASCKFNVTKIRCPGGRDAGDACLSDAQIAALWVMSSDLQLKYPLSSTPNAIDGYHVFAGVDLTARISGLGASAPAPPPLAPTTPIHYMFYAVFTRGMVTRDATADPLAFDAENPGAWQSRLDAVNTILDAWEPDLSKFKDHGGKLIVVHGNDDALIPVGWTERYFKTVVQTMGATAVDGFARFYAVPGYGHGVGAFIVDWDSLTALDRWVERGVAPGEPIATDTNPVTQGRTRPLCRYPAWPRYNGTGDAKLAANFTCTRP